MRSLSLKLGLLYLILAIFNISFFTFIIFENQVDILSENTRFKAEETAENFYTQLTFFLITLAGASDGLSEDDLVNALVEQFEPVLERFMLMQENGDVLFETSTRIQLEEDNVNDVMRAMMNNEVLDQGYYPKINERDNEILFYFPVIMENLEPVILLFQMELSDLNQRLGDLYRLVGFIIIIIAVFHVVFGFILHALIIAPIKVLAGKSAEISTGNYSARVKIKSSDEIGFLGRSFNSMAESIETTISELNQRNEIMAKELQMAAQVQKSIYPDIRKTTHFDIAVYHKPLISVSGDYHNVIDLGDDRYGIIIADVSGHGVSAALITMMIKDQFESLAPTFKDSKEFMENINRSFQNLMNDFDKVFTAFYLIIDKNKVITFSNAAHPKAIVLRPGIKAMKSLDTAEGIFIGLPFADSREYSSRKARLEKGDKIVLYTDGMVESCNDSDQIYGEDRFEASAVAYNEYPCEEMLKLMLKDFHSFCSPGSRRDDETLIIIEMKD